MLDFDRTLNDIPFNGAFVAKNGFCGIKTARIFPTMHRGEFSCFNLDTNLEWLVPADTKVCVVTLGPGKTNYAFAAGVVLGQLQHAGLIEYGAKVENGG